MISIRFVLAIPGPPLPSSTLPMGAPASPTSNSSGSLDDHPVIRSVSLISVTLNLTLDPKEDLEDMSSSFLGSLDNGTERGEDQPVPKEIIPNEATPVPSCGSSLLSELSRSQRSLPSTRTVPRSLPKLLLSNPLPSTLALPTSTPTPTQPTPPIIKPLSDTAHPLPPSSNPPHPHPEPELVTRAKQALIHPNAVTLCEEGVGGTYFIHDPKTKAKLAVFKPTDEEPGSPFNPKRAISSPLLPPGGGAAREVAAYLLDKGFSGVPETHFLEKVTHPAFAKNDNGLKSGSVQSFVDNVGDSSSMGSSRFSVSDVHRIGILDLRLFNMDRNGENILVQKVAPPPLPSPVSTSNPAGGTVLNSTGPNPAHLGVGPKGGSPLRTSRSISQSNSSATPNRLSRAVSTPIPPSNTSYRLIPIDHTYTLPPTLDGAWFEWQYWKQAKEPFSEELINYIKAIDPSKDAELLRKLGIEEQSIRTMMLSSSFLKICAAAGMTLFEIAEMVTRKKKNEPSILEGIVQEVERTALQSTGEERDNQERTTTTNSPTTSSSSSTHFPIDTQHFITKFIERANSFIEKRKPNNTQTK